mmetsp:Transcript_64450/g.127296  ORF Transcript_64450/g.127296 Transcript_64450/m.127296 type:complete len:84 (+) Transcript_64450:1214-1465(+)
MHNAAHGPSHDTQMIIDQIVNVTHGMLCSFVRPPHLASITSLQRRRTRSSCVKAFVLKLKTEHGREISEDDCQIGSATVGASQ